MNNLPYEFHLGDLQGFVLNDLSDTASADDLIVNPNYAALEQVTGDYSFKIDRIPIDYNNLLIKAGDRVVLVDAGVPRPNGNLFLGLEALKLDPGEIDTLVITHSDMDHIGGIVDADGELSFPKASHILLADSWRFWSSQAGRAELARLNNWTAESARVAGEIYAKIGGQLRIVEAGEEFFPGMRLFPAPGHRTDHSILTITKADEQLMHIADALSHPLFMAKREWVSTYDANPSQAIVTKEELLRKCATTQALVFGSHFPFPGLGNVHQDQGKWRWQPVRNA